MPRTRAPYPPEFRRQMVELVRAGRTPRELAREFEPSYESIRNWVRQADRDEGRNGAGLTTDEREDLRRLRRENRQLRLEREILAKAAALRAWGDRRGAARVYEFVSTHQAMYPVATMCRLLGVSTSGYYTWRKRLPSKRARENAQLLKRIEAIHAWSRGTYGAPRIHAELKASGVKVGRNRVARLMRQAGIAGVSRRRRRSTTKRDPQVQPAPDLVERDFTVDSPDQLWVADITYIPTRMGFLYLGVVVDAFSRRVVGWAMAGHLRTELVLAALNMAIWQRRPQGVVHHSDRGTQYTSIAFGRRCREAGVRPSMGSAGDCYDNALCESFFATLECELLERCSFGSQAETQMAVFEFSEGWYNPHRRHSSLDYDSPTVYERKYAGLLASESKTEQKEALMGAGAGSDGAHEP
ncbi:MAG: IS3 family transposase [Candidatus Bipolaricaulaceae bacterium]